MTRDHPEAASGLHDTGPATGVRGPPGCRLTGGIKFQQGRSQEQPGCAPGCSLILTNGNSVDQSPQSRGDRARSHKPVTAGVAATCRAAPIGGTGPGKIGTLERKAGTGFPRAIRARPSPWPSPICHNILANNTLYCPPTTRPQVRHSRIFRHNRYSLPDRYADKLFRSIFLRDVSGRNLRKGCLGGTPR